VDEAWSQNFALWMFVCFTWVEVSVVSLSVTIVLPRPFKIYCIFYRRLP
jgi:hypothetical protein